MQQTNSKMQALMKSIRQMPLFRQLIPMEAGVGWPIPLRKGGKTYVILPFYGYTRGSKERQIVLYPPFATITLDWSNQKPVEYVNLRFRNPWPEGEWETEVGHFPHPAVTQMTVQQYKAKRNELLTMYDEMFENLTQGHPFSAEWSARFGQLLGTLMEPPLEPYYRALSPKFFDRFLPKS